MNKQRIIRGGLVAVTLGLGIVAAQGADNWPSRLWLGRGEYWRQRVGFTVSNRTDQAVAGRAVEVPVGKGGLPLAGVRVESLRLTDARGAELLYAVRPHGRKGEVLRSGAIPEGAAITVPVCAGAKEAATFRFYFGNDKAWALADMLRPCADAKARNDFALSFGSVETLAVKTIGESEAWPGEGGWEVRVPIRVANFSEAPLTAALVTFGLREAVRGLRDPEWCVRVGGEKVDACLLGGQVLFPCGVPARTIRTCFLYAKGAVRRSGIERPADGEQEEVRSALGSIIPSDQVVVSRSRLTDEAAYARLVNSSANLLRNPCFAQGAQNWTHTHEKKGSPVRYEIVPKGGKLGGGYAKVVIPREAAGTWRGWYQTVPLVPGHSYFYGGLFSGEEASGRTTIAAHVFGKGGRTTQMISTGESIGGTTPWTPSFGTLFAKQDETALMIHLTTRESGTYSYNGMLVAESARAEVGDLEMAAGAAATGAGLAVASVDPVVKVFRETSVKDEKGPFLVALARNETEPLQLAVRSPRAVGRLEVEVTPPGTGVSVETGIVGYVPVDYATSYYSLTTPEWELKYPTHNPSCDGWSGWWPDPIRPENACALAANETQAVWLNFRTTAETKPGTCAGKIVWKADGKVVRTDAYAVKVWKFALPAVAETPAIYDLRIGGRWGNDFKGLSNEERRRAFWKFFSEKRICPDSLGGDVTFTRGKDGRLVADFTAYDRLATEYFETFHFPVAYTPNRFYCFGWGLPPKKFLDEEPYEGAWPYADADRTKLRPAYVKTYQEALRLYWNHVKAKGWADRIVLYISDEPHFSVKAVRDQMIALCKMIHEVDPAIRIYSSTWRHCPEWNDSLDVWGVAHYGGFPVDEMKRRAAAGKHIWFTTDGQMCLDTPYCAVERLLPHYCAAYHAEAYEFWGATWLTYDPWQYGWHSFIRQTDTPGKYYYVRYPDGDGYLMYPGIPGKFKGPVTTIRLEAARDGVEDFSYLKALQRLAAGTAFQAEAKALLAEFAALVKIPNAGGRYSTRILPDPERIAALRLRAGTLLDRAAGRSRVPRDRADTGWW